MVLFYESWVFPNITFLAVERIIELKTHIYRYDNVNDECNGLSPEVLLKGFFQFTLPSTTPSTSNAT